MPQQAKKQELERKRGKDERNRCSSGGFLSSSVGNDYGCTNNSTRILARDYERSAHAEAIQDNQDKPFVQEFEPKPSAKAYRDDKLKNERAFVKDFEPRPSATSYLEDKLKYERTFTTNFEPRPRATTYHHDFEPRPNVSSYTDDGEQGKGKSFVTAFEPRPNVSAYIDDVGLNEKKTFEKDFEP
ncbi:organ-specific protein S2-like [Olea europaea var. sylvestris]|uniref:organ-specific protein S2-like n=1 Tax=Olea europaea var. sylvestris TaxID=158386 RepID=UPI000C1D486C|nr:organ-specific protein S2-like [Olea europaea var. sylvestris]